MKAIGIGAGTSLLAGIIVAALLTVCLPLPFTASFNIGLLVGWMTFMVAICCFYPWVEAHKWDD